MAGDILTMVSELLGQGEDLVLARIVRGRGPTPRAAGARMIVLRSGAIAGTIGGGQVEAAAIAKAREAFERGGAVIEDLDLTSEDANAPDMICGGRLTFVCEYIAAADEAVAVFDQLWTGHRELKKNILCTQLAGLGDNLKTVRRFLLGEGLHDRSELSPGLADRLREETSALTGSALIEIGREQYLIDVLESMAALFIFGAGHVGKETAALANNVGFRTVVLDDRAEFAHAGRFPAPTAVRALDSFAACCDGLPVDENTSIVIVTRGHVHDKTVLAQALKTKAGYVGMIGSRKKRDAIYQALRADGVADDDLKRVHCPIGLAIAAETPEEIAVSIVGELIAARAEIKSWTRKT